MHARFSLYFLGFCLNHNKSLCTSLGGIRELKITITANRTNETACCPLKFHLQPYFIDARQVFDESPTPKWESFSKFSNLEYFTLSDLSILTFLTEGFSIKALNSLILLNTSNISRSFTRIIINELYIVYIPINGG
jgi:hypothetical protein